MKFEDLKVGMKVRAIDNFYNFTSKKYQFEGEIIKINEKCEAFGVKTTYCTYLSQGTKNILWYDLKAEHFEPITSEEKETSEVEEVLKVYLKKDTYYVVYKGKVAAKATCSKDDNFNDEFGLNLALRRFCKTLCDENTTKKVIYNTDKVEDFI